MSNQRIFLRCVGTDAISMPVNTLDKLHFYKDRPWRILSMLDYDSYKTHFSLKYINHHESPSFQIITQEDMMQISRNTDNLKVDNQAASEHFEALEAQKAAKLAAAAENDDT